ncbi:MAG: trehalose-phosphatase [Candidatus Omnitrophica bacterium]|nr:trehalose-phosphatase [Candidatus Omnitrophota bacterium]
MRHTFYDLEKIKRDLKGKYIFLFLDYDGTLTPIVKTPDKAIISQETKRLLYALSEKNNCRIAIISGRDLVDIKKMVGLKNIIYSGNHGLQIEGPKIKHELAVSSGYKKILRSIKIQLKERLCGIKGVLIEDKKLSLALHFRLVDRKQLPFVKTVFHEIIILYLAKNKIKIKYGKEVLEVRPPVQWDKGKVVLWLLARQKFAKAGAEVLPVYIGDDITDEDAFKAFQRLGITILVGKPKPSYAHYYLKNPDEVKELFRRIIKF